MTARAAADRPRILAHLAENPGQTAYEVAAALGYSKPQSHRVAQLVKRLHQAGVLVAGSQFRPLMGRPASVFCIAPPGTPPQPRRELPATKHEARRRRDRINQQRRRARLAGKPTAPEPADRPRAYLPAPPPAWHIPGDPACAGANPVLFFRPHEATRARARRVAKAIAYCHGCPVQRQCLDTARERGERWGVWGGTDLETEHKRQPAKAARPGAVTPSRT